MPINIETQLHGAAILVLFENLGDELPDISFTLKTGTHRNSYIVEALRPSVLGKGKRLSCGLYLKTSQKRRSPWRYSYLMQHQDEISEMRQKFGEVFNVYVNGNDGFSCIDFSDLKQLLDEHHEEQEWVAVTRKPREGYRISGTDGVRETPLRKNNFPSAITDYFKKHLS
jgi:hypothetical protein